MACEAKKRRESSNPPKLPKRRNTAASGWPEKRETFAAAKAERRAMRKTNCNKKRTISTTYARFACRRKRPAPKFKRQRRENRIKVTRK